MLYHITKHRCYTIYSVYEVDDNTWLLSANYNKLAPRPVLFEPVENRVTIFDNKPVSKTLLVAFAMHVYGEYSGIKSNDTEIARDTMDALRERLNRAVEVKLPKQKAMLRARAMLQLQ